MRTLTYAYDREDSRVLFNTCALHVLVYFVRCAANSVAPKKRPMREVQIYVTNMCIRQLAQFSTYTRTHPHNDTVFHVCP